MKKTLKSILAITLVLIMSFGTLTAFAAAGDKLEWYFDEYLYEYTWQNELQDGSVTFTVEPSEDTQFQYFTFNSSDGYYLVTCTYSYYDGNVGWIGMPEKMINGIAYDSREVIWYSENLSDEGILTISILYELEAGENIIGADVYSYIENIDVTISAEYIGETVTDFDISKKEYLANYDIALGETEGWIYTDATIVFSDGTTQLLEGIEIEYSCADGVAEGENTLTFDFLGVEKDFNVSVNGVDYYIADVELSNKDKYCEMFVDYNEDYWCYNVTGETLTVTFTDSTQQDVFIDDGFGIVEFPNGTSYPVYIYNDREYYFDDNFYLYIIIGNTEIEKHDCTITRYSVVNNGAILIEDNKSEFRNFFANLYWGLDDALVYNTVAEIFHSLFGTFFDTLANGSNLLNNLFSNIILFIKFYIVG